MNDKSRARYVFLACGLLATAALTVAAALWAAEARQQIARQHAERFLETGTLYAATLARIAEQYIDEPGRNQIELATLAETGDGLTDSLGITITGSGRASPRSYEYIWASSDSRRRGADGSLRYIPGQTLIEDDLSPDIGRIIESLNAEAARELAELGPQIEAVTRSIVGLLMQTRQAGDAELAEMDNTFRVLYGRGTRRLAAVSRRHAGTVPAVQPGGLAELDDDVLFYHPIAVFDRSESAWYAGMIRLRRAVAPSREELQRAQREMTERSVRNALVILGALWAALGAVWLTSKPRTGGT